MSLAWLESTEHLRLTAADLAASDALRTLDRLGLLTVEVDARVGCTDCHHQCPDLPVRSDALSLSVSPRGARLVVFCPYGEWEGGRPVDALPSGRMWNVSRPALLHALQRANPLPAPRERPAPPGTVRLGTTRLGEHEADVVFAHGLLTDDVARALRGLRKASLVDLVVVSPDAMVSEETRRLLAQEGIAYVSIAALLTRPTPSLELPWMWPRLRPHIFADPTNEYWLCHDVELIFAEGEDGHQVIVNGEPSPYFEKSDVAFAQLLRLAVARSLSARVGPGGMVEREEIDPDPKQKGLDDLRTRLVASLPPYRQVTGRQLVRSTGDGKLWLAFHPQSLKFDRSLKEYRSQAGSVTADLSTAGKRMYAKGLQMGRQRARQLLDAALRVARLEAVLG